MNIKTENGCMGPREEEITHRVAPLRVTGPGIPRTSERALLAVGQSRTNEICERNKQVDKVIPQIEITQTRKGPATPTGGMFQGLEQQR